MFPSLLVQTGRVMRILRGCQLNSSYAPQYGVRYDGLWKLTSYRHHADSEGVYHLQLTLERLDGQSSMSELVKIPRPSQIDDWNCYSSLELKNVGKTSGSQGVFDYRVLNEEERHDREEWRRLREFRSSIGAGPSKPLSGVTGLGITHEPDPSFSPSLSFVIPPQKGIMKLRLPPAIQAKADKAEREAKLKREGSMKRAVIDTSLNQEYKSKSRDSD